MSRTVSLLNRFEDPTTSNDPRVRSVVAKLGAVDYAPAVRPEFRDELRAQLVAIAARVVAEGDVAEGAVAQGVSAEADSHGPATLDPAAAARTASTDNVTPLARPATSASHRRSHARRVGRPLGLAAACCAVLALGLGGAVWKSRSALPGDSLYGLKRTSESVQLSLTRGDTARGHEYLRLASTRVQEAQDLLSQDSALATGSGSQASGLSPSTVSLIKSTLSSANSDVYSGSSLLGTAAVTSDSISPLSIMTAWAPGQRAQLKHLASSIGNGPAKASARHSWTIVNTALDRAKHLQKQVGTKCSASKPDAYGPTGCVGSTEHTMSPTSTPGHHQRTAPGHDAHTTPSRSHATHHPSTRGSSAPTSGPPRHTKHHPSGTTSSTPPDGLLPTKVPTTLPTKVPTVLPTTLVPSIGVGVKSCGISVGIGPIQITAGSCPTGS